MKIAFLSQPLDKVLPPSQNSIGIWIYEVARRLATNHDIVVYANNGLRSSREVVLDKITFRLLRAMPYKRAQYLSATFSRIAAPDKPFFASKLYWLEYGLQAALDIRRRGVDLVHIVNFSQFVPIIRALNPTVKIVLHMQCEWLSQLNRKMIDQRLAQTDLMIGCSEYITQLVRDRFPQHAARCHTVYNGVKENDFYPRQAGDQSERPFRLLFVSRLSPEKGVHILLQAFRLVAKHYPTTQLELIGSPGAVPYEYLVRMTQDESVAQLRTFYEGSYMDHLRSEIPETLKAQVLFTGHVDRPSIPDHFRLADILINPSLSEPFGMALVEGMASGIPVIAPRIGGMVEIIDHGKTGLLVNANDADDLANAILRLLDNGALRASMGRQGRQRVLDLFTWDRIVEQLLLRYNVMYAGVGHSIPAEPALG